MILVEIAPPRFDVDLEIAYASERNLTGRPVYARAACYLHPAAADALERAIGLAAALGLRLRVYDGFRPTEAQEVFWRFRPDPDYFTPPERGSPHSRGVAIDLTLVRGADGAALEMGTGFDTLSPRSHHGSLEVSAEAQRNRYLLLGLMSAAGFDFYGNEWWHYQLFNARRFPLLSDSAAGTRLMPQPA
jgi:D-alanyl-D-alanine dipeptidase